mgnify:CR=1 FL=1
MKAVLFKGSSRAVILGLFGAAMVCQTMADETRQAGPIWPVALGYDTFSYRAIEDGATPSPSDLPPPPPVDETLRAAETQSPSATWVTREPYGAGVFRRCNLGDPWTIPQPCPTKALGMTLSGWASAGLYANGYQAASNGPLGFNSVGDGFNLHQLWVALDRTAELGGDGWDWGFHVDYVFGVDGPDTQSFGDQSWDFGWNAGRDYGSAIPQLYGELAYKDLKIKGGHFYTIIGYEVVQAPSNFFYSNAYTRYYGEPFTHTGFIASWKYNDHFTFHGGWTAGWDAGWENRTDGSTFLGGITCALTDKHSLAWALSTGKLGDGLGNVYMNSIVWTWKLQEKWTYVLQHDLGTVTGLGIPNSEWYGINQLLLYNISDCWGLGLRFEWFRDDDGTRVVAGNAGDYYELTAGLNWRPHANLVLRPEIRYDWYSGTLGSGQGPFDHGRENQQLSGGFDLIFTY